MMFLSFFTTPMTEQMKGALQTIAELTLKKDTTQAHLRKDSPRKIIMSSTKVEAQLVNPKVNPLKFPSNKYFLKL